MKDDAEYLPHCFRHFADICEGSSPLYAALSRRVADDPQVLALVADRQSRQPPSNLLFGSVHYQLLSGVDHALADFYLSVGGHRSPDQAYPAFADFCGEFRERLVETISTPRVQTNEVGRCGLLMPAFALAWERCGRTRLDLIDVGCSAGLNLLFDHYHYEYSDGRRCGPDSEVRIRTELRGHRICPLPQVMPQIAERVGEFRCRGLPVP
ncbi:MAG: DUF2332 domain-containing protein [Planctomycetes bacterium]|nr:DUF2332 domain-containing protein [Planctomycetota bacterium]